MEESKEKICRLCLSCESDKFSKLEASAIGKLKAVVPEVNVKFPNDYFLCSKCKHILERSFELKIKLSKNNDLIEAKRKELKVDKLDLSVVIKTAKPIDRICRICLKITEGVFVNIDKENNCDDTNVILKRCFPELDTSWTTKLGLCASCHSLLCQIYNFKKDCLTTEEKIESYQETSSDDIDLGKVLQMSKLEEENDFLSGFEIQDEEGTDIFDYIQVPAPQEESDKPPAVVVKQEPEEEETIEIKRQKMLDAEIVSEDLPRFKFDQNLLCAPRPTDLLAEDWIAKVEQYRRKFNWSDYTTIHKVLVRLKGINELYIWFSNIADIMDWDQWKTKLILAFPKRDEYNLLVKKVMARKKKKEETYVAYYNDKLKLMEGLNWTDEQKVSCIFGGINDILVCCVGRVGGYKTPESLIDYFKSCDDKQSVEKSAERSDEKKKTVLIKKKKRNKWFFQRFKIGQSMAECDNSSAKSQVQKSPNSVAFKKLDQAAKKFTKLSDIHCYKCNKVGHIAEYCFTKDNNQSKPFTSQYKAPTIPTPVERCTGCNQKGHTISKCFAERSKKRETHKNQSTSSSPQPKRKRTRPDSSRGSQRHSTYIGSYSAQPTDYSKQICMKCYKIGHVSSACQERTSRFSWFWGCAGMQSGLCYTS